MFIIKEEDSRYPDKIEYLGVNPRFNSYYVEPCDNINAVSPYGHTSRSLYAIKCFIQSMRKKDKDSEYKIFTLLVVNGKNEIQNQYQIDDIMNIYDAKLLK